jgi:RNA polymerase sigma factor (sigma-70 family)
LLASLIAELTPVIRSRVGQRLCRSGAVAYSGEARFEAEDLTQEILMHLFERNGRTLRRWDAGRGLSLHNFVRLVAQRHVVTVLRRQWLHKESAAADEQLSRCPDPSPPAAMRLEGAEIISQLMEALRARLTSRAMRILELLHFEDRSVAEVSAMLEMTPNALYAARNRIRGQLRAIARELQLLDEDGWSHCMKLPTQRCVRPTKVAVA